MMTIYHRAALVAAISLAAAGPAFAQSNSAESTDLGVSANVTKNCVVSAAPLEFGDVDVTGGATYDGTAALSVRCTNGTEWVASADAGLGTGATTDVRRMQNGANLLSYTLYTDPARTVAWGGAEGDEAGLINGIGTGTQQLTTIYGRVFAGQTSLPSGSYEDTVHVTVSYF